MACIPLCIKCNLCHGTYQGTLASVCSFRAFILKNEQLQLFWCIIFFLHSPFSLKIEVNVPPAHTHYFNPHSVVDRPSPSDSIWCSLALCLSVLLFPPLDGDFYFSMKKRWHGLLFYLTVSLLDSCIHLVRYLVELKENFAKCWLESLLQKKVFIIIITGFFRIYEKDEAE